MSPTPLQGIPVQALYPDDAARCYGCGRLNERGHHVETYVAGFPGSPADEGEGRRAGAGLETEARFTPETFHTALPGYVYGGLLASLVDCHGTGSAAAAALAGAGHDLRDPDPGLVPGDVPRFVTARLEVDYERPTPLGPELRLRGRVAERTDRKAVVEVELSAEGRVTVRGRVVAVRLPENFGREG